MTSPFTKERFPKWSRYLACGDNLMADEPDKPNPMNGQVIQRLVHETGVTHEQARELVALLGPNWSSLVREAKLLNRKRQAGSVK